MKKPRKVRGLFGILEAEANGEEWKAEELSPDFVPGMGFGATKEATRWAYIGYISEHMHRLKSDLKKSRGRPGLPVYANKDCKRAFTLWWFAQKFDEDKRRNVSQRELIRLVIKMEDFLQIPNFQKVFPEHQNFESSVSRGKRHLQIDDSWNSEVCEEIAGN
jgi:hypothetical protein